VPEACTSITVGSTASSDGSVITSHTCDSHRTRGWLDVTPAKDYKKGDQLTLVKRAPYDSLAMPTYQYLPVGEIPKLNIVTPITIQPTPV